MRAKSYIQSINIFYVCARFLATHESGHKNHCWIAAVPATFMSAVSVTYLLYAPECLNLGARGETGITISYTIGIIAAAVLLGIFLFTTYRHPEKSLENQSKIHLERK